MNRKEKGNPKSKDRKTLISRGGRYASLIIIEVEGRGAAGTVAEAPCFFLRHQG